MANNVTRTEHNRAKNGRDAGYRGPRADAKRESNRRRRTDDRTTADAQRADRNDTDERG